MMKKKRNKRKRNKKLEENHNFNHYLMYESKTSLQHVVEDEWFKDEDETTIQIYYRV